MSAELPSRSAPAERSPASASPAGVLETHRPGDPGWDSLVRSAPGHDFYHLAGYHALAEARGEGRAILFAYRQGASTIGLPLLLRRTAEVPGLGRTPWLDATSVYGYPGPVCAGAPASDGFGAGFRTALRRRLEAMGVVAMFSRLHPLLPQPRLLEGLGQIGRIGPTASIDLTRPDEEQRRAMDPKHRNQISKLRRSGAVCLEDPEGRCLAEFVEIYLETMHRVQAPGYYHFDRGYFEQLRAALPGEFRLFVVRLDGRTICAGVFMMTGSIVQYHLSGTLGAAMRLAPMKLLLDEVRLWAIRAGATRFHLGGGVGAREDALFDFKRRFATDLHDFHVWRWMVDEQRYRQLCALRGVDPSAGAPHSFFPIYRK